MKPRPGTIVAPPELTRRYRDWAWEVAWQYDADSVTYRLGCPRGEVHFLKLNRTDSYPGVSREARRMSWAVEHVPVPRVLEEASDSGVSWLITEGLAGADATNERWAADPGRVVGLLAAGLRRFHEISVAECPFDFRLDAALAHAAERVSRGEVDPAQHFHEEFAHYSSTRALAVLEETRPSSEMLVVCHGDYCPPNVLIDEWCPTGYVDLGELGVADRWWDLAVATWSVAWNFGGEYEDLFLAEYGIERDQGRIDYYRLLYDIVS